MRKRDAHLILLLPLFLFLGLLPRTSRAQVGPNGYTCSTDRSIYPCDAYALYRASEATPDLASVGDLFGLSRLAVARASNLTANATLLPDQPLLVPLNCFCDASTNLSYAAISYQIAKGDTFYLVSTFKFENLTNYTAVEVVNPALVPTDLEIGVEPIFPIYCQCPNRTTTTNTSFNHNSTNLALVTYVYQPSDTLPSIASRFGSDVPSLVSLNGGESSIKPFSAILVPVNNGTPPPWLLQQQHTSELSSPKCNDGGNTGPIVGLGIGLGFMAFVCVFELWLLVWFWRRSRRTGRGRDHQEGKFRPAGEHLMADISEFLDKYRVYQIDELKRATLNFDQSCLIQGSVYRGTIGSEVYAVKKMKWNAADELKILQKVNHTNLVKLEGFCIDADADAGTCYLVYEYVENGSLHTWLHGGPSSRPHSLDWRTRLRIAIDLANGLQYIHEHTWPRVVHKDIKSGNVLLDARMRAKIANFGLARTGCNAVTAHIIGTQGYIAPEYLADGIVSTKMDVFAYGVVLLELVSCKNPVNEKGQALWMDVDKVFGKEATKDYERLRAWMDESLSEQSSCPAPMESVGTLMSVAKACLQKDPSKRPTMMEVAYMLSRADEMSSDFSLEGLMVGSSVVMGLTAR